MARLAGNVAITVATQVVGKAHASTLTREGANVVPTDLKAEQGRAIVQGLCDATLWRQDVAAAGRTVAVVAALPGTKSSAGAACCASNWPVRGMGKLVAAGHGQDRAGVESVHPGFVLSPTMVAAADAHGGGAVDAIPLGGWHNPTKISAWSSSWRRTKRRSCRVPSTWPTAR